jgi:hypothetical protein
MKKAHKVWKLEDLRPRDMELLSEAAARPDRTFFCFGLAWYKLFDLNLIDEDMCVTPYGKGIAGAYARMSQ